LVLSDNTRLDREPYQKEALERLVQLYDATRQKDKADEWRKQRETSRGTKEPAKP
jgi:hypothetical protein